VNLHPNFAAALMSRGVAIPKTRTRELRRWELRERGLLPPHSHAGELARRAKQLKWRAAKQQAARRLAHGSYDGLFAGRAQIIREIRSAPHVYL
jgi:predicted component of type VI protein secretion system